MPLLGETAEGDNINILVIDSEGIGALDEDSTHDSRIFALIFCSQVALFTTQSEV